MNRRDKAIMDWVEKNRPDMIGYFREIITDGGFRLGIVAIGFEAGRKFQIEHPKSRLGKPNTFL